MPQINLSFLRLATPFGGAFELFWTALCTALTAHWRMRAQCPASALVSQPRLTAEAHIPTFDCIREPAENASLTIHTARLAEPETDFRL